MKSLRQRGVGLFDGLECTRPTRIRRDQFPARQAWHRQLRNRPLTDRTRFATRWGFRALRARFLTWRSIEWAPIARLPTNHRRRRVLSPSSWVASTLAFWAYGLPSAGLLAS